MLIKMLEVAPSNEGEGGHGEIVTSAKEDFSKEGLSIPPLLKASVAEVVCPLCPSSPSSEGATSNILINTGSYVVSGRGAGHRISFS